MSGCGSWEGFLRFFEKDDESARKIFILTKRKWAKGSKKRPDLKVGILKSDLILMKNKSRDWESLIKIYGVG